MISTQACLDALAQGYTLTNGNVYVSLDKFGAQVIRNPNPKHPEPYSFDSPQFWHIHTPNPEVVSKSYAIWALIAISLFFNFALYIAYDSVQTDLDSLQQTYNQILYDNNQLASELRTYHVTEQELIELGATEGQARDIIKSSELYGIDPKDLGR